MRRANKNGTPWAEANKLRDQAAALRRAERAKKKPTAKKAKPKRAKSDAPTQSELKQFLDTLNKPLTKAEIREAKEYRDELHTYSDAGDDLTINPIADNKQVIGLKKKAQRLELELAQVGGKSRAPQLEADLETEKQIAQTLEAQLASLEAELKRRDQQLVEEFITAAALRIANDIGPEDFMYVSNSTIDAILKVLTRE